MRTRSSLVALVACVGCGTKSSSDKPVETKTVAPAPSPALGRCGQGELAASAPDGVYLVHRDKDIDVCGANGDKIAALPLGADARPGNWFAVSRGGTRVVFAQRDGKLELWQTSPVANVWQFDASDQVAGGQAMPLTGEMPVAPVSWGPPQWLDDTLFVTHHTRGVVVWDLAAKKARCGVTDETITLARSTYAYDAKAQTFWLRAGSDRPGPANVYPFLISLAQCAVVGRVVPAHDASMIAERHGDSVLSTVPHGLALTTGTHTELLALPNHDVSALFLDDKRLLWGTSTGTVTVVDRASGKTAELADGSSSIARVYATADAIFAIDGKGGRHQWPTPALTGAAVQWTALPPAEDAWQHAIIAIGDEDLARRRRSRSSSRRRIRPSTSWRHRSSRRLPPRNA